MLKEDKIDIASVRELLSEVLAFKTLDNNVISDIAATMSLLKFEAGEHIIWAGSIGQYLLVVSQGTVYVSLDSLDIELGRGSIVGEMALLSRKPSKADVVALTDAEGFAVNHDDFLVLMEKHAGLASAMTELMKSRMFGDNGINRIGDYRVMDQYSEGYMADVYNAVDSVSGRAVIIKMLNYEQTSQADFKQRFKKDFATIIKLKHSNILQVLETVEDYSTEFIIMDDLDGYNLTYHLEKSGVLKEKQTSDIISKVALALAYAGDEENGGLIHCGVNLSNIVLDDMGNVKLMGFGLALNEIRKIGNDEASLPYLAPEVLQNNSGDYRADIYALGVTAFVMLTGKTPYAAATLDELIEEQKQSLSPDINSMVRDLPAGLAEFINRALINDPELRISNWFEIQTLLVAGKGSSLNLLADTDKDMALVIKLHTLDVDTKILNQELHQVLDNHHVNYEIEVVTKDNTDVDFSR